MVKKQEFNFIGTAETLIAATPRIFSQSFTVGTLGDNGNYSVSEIMLAVSKIGETGNLLWTIEGVDSNGHPNRDIFSQGTILGSAISTTQNIITSAAQNSNRRSLKIGTKYALVIVSESAVSAGNQNKIYQSASSEYTGGSYSYTMDGGQNWIDAATDLVFSINGEIFTGTLCEMNEVINKAGKNANSDSIRENMINRFVEQAESLVCSVTRINWVKLYKDLDENTRNILNQVVSDIAATYVITYDMSGYSDRVEAETMINVYRETIARGLGLLKKQEVATFLKE